MIEAAGGVVWRRGSKGRLSVLLVHRDRYDDWTLPKGKLEPDETHHHAALREVEEETGLRCATHEELPEVRYTYATLGGSASGAVDEGNLYVRLTSRHERTRSAEEIAAWCRERMASYKVPRLVEILESLPKSATGKVAWRLLQEREAGGGSRGAA